MFAGAVILPAVPVCPRVRDSLQIVPVAGLAGQHAVCETDGRELFRLTSDGIFLLCQLDGRTSGEELLLRFEERFDREMSREELGGFLDGLEAAGVFVSDQRALDAMTYLLDQDVSWRGGLSDRRAGSAPDPDRERRDAAARRADSTVTSWWNHAVFHLNAGHLEHAQDIFTKMSQAAPGDLRLRRMAHHLAFLLATEQDPNTSEDRRDVDWEVFDAALGEMLLGGACPRCDAALHVELGATNRCPQCGGSFSTWILGQPAGGRRGADGLFGDAE